ncbi:MAG: PilZ domain-containing protein [Pseudomonadota bacterium]
MPRRAHQRYPADMPAALRVVDPDDVVEVWLKDLSLGGAFVVTDKDLKSGSTLELSFNDPELGEVVLTAQVVHQVSPQQAELWGTAVGIGLRFVALDAARAGQLEALLAALQARLDRAVASASFDTAVLVQVELAQRKGALHAVLGLEPDARRGAIASALHDRTAAIDALMQLPLPDDDLRGRLIAARLAVQRAGELLCDDRQRASYLLRSESLPPEQIAQALADAPEGLHEAERTWEMRHPQQVTAARDLAQHARAAAEHGDAGRAHALAVQALALHPFWQELSQDLERWAEPQGPEAGADPGDEG